MRQSIRGAVAAGLPTVAECGGFLYLGQTLEDAEGGIWPMAGVLWACGFANEHFYAGFPHLYWAGTPLPERFVAAAESYQNKRGSL